MDTPLATNWRKDNATSSEEVGATIYRQLVGYLMYVVNTRPDMCYVVYQLSQYMVSPAKLYWKATKHVIQNLRGYTEYGLWYRRKKGVNLQGFTNLYWARSPSNKKSTSSVTFSVGYVAIS